MPTLVYNRAGGVPIIDVTVRYHALNGVPHPSGTVPVKTLRALVDTGASHAVLQPEIVRELGLPFLRDMKNTVTGGKTHKVRGHVADVIFGNIDRFTVTDLLVLSQRLVGYDMILGWDAIRFTDWSFDRDGTFRQSW